MTKPITLQHTYLFPGTRGLYNRLGCSKLYDNHHDHSKHRVWNWWPQHSGQHGPWGCCLQEYPSTLSPNTWSLQTNIWCKNEHQWSPFYSNLFKVILNTELHKPRFRQARVFVHFHSFSCVATLTSSITKGTHPPKTYILRGNIEKIKSQWDAATKHSLFYCEFKHD